MTVFKRISPLIPVVFFLLYLVIGLFIYDDYGMSWDEALQRDHGLVSAKYIDTWIDYTDHNFFWQDLYEYPHRYYGVWFSTPMAWLEKGLDLKNFRQYFHLRHLSVFLLFFIGCFFFYRILHRRFKHWAWALLGTLFLILSPRIFAHSFYNPKDIPLLVLYVISTYTLFRFWFNPSVKNSLLHGMACGMLISMRVVGLIMPLMTLFLLFMDMLLNKTFQPAWYKRYFKGLIIYIPSLLFFTVLFWPYLWKAPFHHLRKAFDAMSQYAWEGKLIFNGEWMYGTEVPWNYLPHWISISTPILYLLLAMIGLVALIPPLLENVRRQKGKCLWYKDEERMDWAMPGLFLAPILAVIVKDSVVYDGWRHVFFVYPALIYMAVLGAYKFWGWIGSIEKKWTNWVRYTFITIIIGGIAPVWWFMIKNHPHQNVYFNDFRSGDQFGQYDLDYWGNSYKQGMEALVEIDTRDTIRLAYSSFPATLNYEYLHPEIRRRILLVEKPEEADYYISTYRHWEQGIQQAKERKALYAGERVHEIVINGTRILGVYKLDK
ncbi:MAG: hypothetical protein MI974_06675 [Chitinophagales bacterium]|nr:hypothetical protein [Chitinophagales bacterium]